MTDTQTSSTYGFELIREEFVAERDSLAQLLVHTQSGARLLSMQNSDENKVFGISFRTPPEDSNGVAHILEHCVLGGSKKYPLKEPFVELVKGSLNTFVNAMTYPDKTVYPVASPNHKDFYNLVDVYLDAVLNPLITPDHLAQEGWHYELNDLDKPLTYKGVVFNEMKGAYSSRDGFFARSSGRSLFPDNIYGYDSGGDPEEIPTLTYEKFKKFHENYYHPSNAYIYFYGDDDPQKRLEILASYLDEFTVSTPNSAISLQPRWQEPRSFTYYYSVDPKDDSSNSNGSNGHREANGAVSPAAISNEDGDPDKAMLRLNWLLGEITDPAESMGLSVLSYVLMGTSAAPLRKRLVDSGLGEDVIGGGLGSGGRETTFSVGLKGIALEGLETVEPFIRQTIEEIYQEGIDPALIDAALNTFEFSLRENNTGSYPRGLYLMLNALGTWLYDQDPLLFVKYEKPLQEASQRIQNDPSYLQSLIKIHLLDNTHQSTTLIKPQPGMDAEKEAAEKEHLAQTRSMMSEDELLTIIQQTQELRERQQAQDPPEVLAKLPRLGLEDLATEEMPIPIDIRDNNGTEIITHDLFTSGIVYLHVGFDMHPLPQRLLPYMSLFGGLLTQMGTESQDFTQLQNRIGTHTGGVSTSRIVSGLAEGSAEQCGAWFLVRAKATLDKTDEMLHIIRDILLTVKLDNVERFRQLVLRAKAGAESGLIPSGHSVVSARLRGQFSAAASLSEQLSGITNLFFLRELADRIESDWPSVLADLEEIRRTLVNRSHMFCNVTIDEDGYQKFEPQLSSFIDSMPAFETSPNVWQLPLNKRNEGLTIPAQVNYVGKGANLYELGYNTHGSIWPITNFLRTTWLWSNVRIQGGAYGAFCSFAKRSGTLTYLSYRDPNLTDTLDVYDGTANFLRSTELDENDLIRSIIGAISSIDGYQLPDAKGYTSMLRHLIGDKAEERQQIREEVLGTTQADFHRFADVLDEVAQQGQIVVLGSQGAIDGANEILGGKLNHVKVM